MQTLFKTIVLSIFLMATYANAQEHKLKKAEKKFEDYAFVHAVDDYEKLVKEGHSQEVIFKRLGDANYLNAKYATASQWYQKLLELKPVGVESKYMYRYAQSLKSTGNYKTSDEWMAKFEQSNAQDIRADLYANNQNYLEKIKSNSGRYAINNVTLNSEVSDFSPAFYQDKLIFSTARDTGGISKNIHNWNNGHYLNFYEADLLQDGTLGPPRKFSRRINSKVHESSAVFTKDGKTIYFTRNNSNKGRFKRDDAGVSRLKIYKAHLENGKWTNGEELPFNSDTYSTAHPALSKDEKTLYFSSDMPGTIGSSDIFSVALNADGSFDPPKNLGPDINTESRETFPFVDGNTLYFVSDGHPGLGGLDVFAAKLDVTNKEVMNLGEPINGREDDFSFIINETGIGYFSSNRTGGKGGDDIYGFIENKPLNFDCYSQFIGQVVSKDSITGLIGAHMAIIDQNGNRVDEFFTLKDGRFERELDCRQQNYRLSVNKAGYQPMIMGLNLTDYGTTNLKIVLPKISADQPIEIGANLLSFLNLDPILFDYGKFNIRDDARSILGNVAQYLKENLDVNIAINAHTDAKDSHRFNQKLSDKRARATHNYLTDLGVAPSRIIYGGHGKRQLLNDCTIWENCTPEQNQKNRRSEIMVTQP